MSRVQMSSHAFDLKIAHYKDVSCQAKDFRRQVKKGLLTAKEMEEKRQTVYSLYADAMNDLERWTGKGSKLLVTQHWETNFLQSTSSHYIGREHLSIDYSERWSRHTVF